MAVAFGREGSVIAPVEMQRKLRRLCLSLPETSEVAAWGHPNFRAGKRTFAVYETYKGRPCIAVKIDPLTREGLLQHPSFFPTPIIGKHGWLSIWVDGPVDWNLIKKLVTGSYRLVALKRMLANLEER